MTPRDTLRLLDELQKLGFLDEHFAKVHHWRKKKKSENIASHRGYCERVGSFLPDQDNERVAQARIRSTRIPEREISIACNILQAC